jgi:tRNA-dihydrouridine synthase 1
LQEDWDLVCRMIRHCRSKLSVPVTAKIRILDSVDRTIAYAQRLESAGVSMLTIHGRTREQKGQVTGVADWKHVAAVRRTLKIPVLSNGNIEYAADVKYCLDATNADGVMSAEGLLHNPALFSGEQKLVWDLAEEYLELAEQYPHEYSLTYSRGHVFKIMHHALQEHLDVRQQVAAAKDLKELFHSVREMKSICGSEKCQITSSVDLPFPHWIAQPYRRPLRKENNPSSTVVTSTTSEQVTGSEPMLTELNPSTMDAVQLQRQERKRHKIERKLLQSQQEMINGSKRSRSQFPRCVACIGNPKGLRCSLDMCRSCCKENARINQIDCPGHGFLFLTWASRQQNPHSVTCCTSTEDVH